MGRFLPVVTVCEFLLWQHAMLSSTAGFGPRAVLRRSAKTAHKTHSKTGKVRHLDDSIKDQNIGCSSCDCSDFPWICSRVLLRIASWRSSYGRVKNGDSEEKVIAFFGPPTTREHRGTGYRRYVDDACIDPCVERLWFENRMSIVDEAWFVALDKDRRVLKTAHLTSP